MKKILTSLEITKLLIFFELFSVWSSIKTWFLEMVYLWTGRILSDDEKENELIKKMVLTIIRHEKGGDDDAGQDKTDASAD